MRPRVSRLVWLGLALLTLPVLALLGLELYLLGRANPDLLHESALVAHSLEVLGTTRALERAIQDAERGQRGYLLTGQEAYLEPYRAAVEEAPAFLAKLRTLTAGNPEHERRMPNLEREVGIKLDELRETLEVFQRQGLEAGRREVLTSRGLDAMREITGLIDATVALENSVLKERMARVEAAEQRAALAAGVGGALTLVIAALGAAVMLVAVREIRRSEAARHESETRFRLFVESVTDYAIYLLDPEGRVTSWNAGAERIKGYTAEEIVGQHFSRFYTEEDRAAGLPERTLEVAEREGRSEDTGWRVRKDGSRFQADAIVTRVLDREGKLAGFAKITRDVSEQAAQQKILEQTRAALAQAQKMEALGQLSGGMAHDFNNLLHVIGNAVDALRRRVGTGDPSVVRFLDLCRSNTDRAAALTKRVLAFSRRQPLEPRPIEPNKLVLGMAELLRQTLGERVAIETVLAGGAWSISADPNQLETAILNLAVNARDAMPGGGKLTLETANTFLDEAYSAVHEELTPGQYVMIALSDTGAGMTKEVAAKAFEPFFTTKETGRGTGLGLSQVYGFIKQSGGHVNIYSEPGEGTTVKLYLPRLVGGEPAEPVKEARPSSTAETAGETILVVEDDAHVRAFAVEALEELGYRVLSAADADAALGVIEARERVDLLFTDVGLPGGVNGKQLADAARERRPALKVLFTTAYARNAIVHHGRLDPGVELLLKPFTHTDLASKIRRVLDADGAGPGEPGAR